MKAKASRRSFLGLFGAVVAALVTLPASLANAKKVAISLAKVPKLKKVRGSAVLRVKKRTVLFVRDTEKTVRAFNPECTHQKCGVRYLDKDNRLHCDCHKSAYDLDGKVLDGPAPKPLGTYPAELSGERIILTLPD